jgi:AraC-like DNA-binding protein
MIKFTIDKNDFKWNINKFIFEMDFEEHIHDCYEMVIVTSGWGTHIVNGNEYSLKPGDIYIINEDSSHGFKDTKDLEIYSIAFTQESLYSCGNEVRKALLRAYFIDMIIYLSRNYQEILQPNPENKVGLFYLSKAVGYIENNFSKKINMEEVAKISGFSRRHFNRLFIKYYHQTPFEYLISLRLEMAGKLLAATKKSILDISLVTHEPGTFTLCIDFCGRDNKC